MENYSMENGNLYSFNGFHTLIHSLGYVLHLQVVFTFLHRAHWLHICVILHIVLLPKACSKASSFYIYKKSHSLFSMFPFMERKYDLLHLQCATQINALESLNTARHGCYLFTVLFCQFSECKE